MSPVAAHDLTTLEAALRDVHATLTELLGAAEAQRAALETGDRARLEAITQQQERLTARLEQAERRRLDAMPAGSVGETLASLRGEPGERIARLTAAIGQAVLDLRQRHARNAALLERSIDLAGQTIQYLQRLVMAETQTYGTHSATLLSASRLVDSRA
jgi:flagellar biosynthesis/type III secretory pathway chaperone